MKLYIFESCPFCNRVRAFLALSNLSAKLIYLSPGETPSELQSHISSPSVPILDDGGVIIQESSAIMHHLNTKSLNPVLKTLNPQAEIQNWINKHRTAFNRLCYPRLPFLSLPELSAASVLSTFLQGIEERMGVPINTALNNSEILCRDIIQDIDLALPCINNSDPSIDQIILIAELRNLSMVQEFTLAAEPEEAIQLLMQRFDLPSFPAISAKHASRLA